MRSKRLKKPSRGARGSTRGNEQAPQAAKTGPLAGKRYVRGVGNRLNRTQLSERLRLDRKTVSKYLAMQGAPKPDKLLRYDVETAKAWIESQAPKLGGNSEEMRKIREAVARMEMEDLALDLAEKKGRLVDKAKIEPTIAALMSALTTNMRNKFEFELPPKYEGVDQASRAKLNADAIDWILSRLKSGAIPLTA